MNPIQALRTRGWARTVAIRRLVAAGLVVLAAFLALRPNPADEAPMVVAASDLAPGTALSMKDVELVRAPPALVPTGALTEASTAVGQILTGAAAEGEPITSKRLLGKENIRLVSGLPDASAVPVRLPDSGIADLLAPGARVDIISPDRKVLASSATVLLVRPTSSTQSRLAIVALPHDTAATVAATSLTQELAVTLR
jgi:pilus assembly protein CpaB